MNGDCITDSQVVVSYLSYPTIDLVTILCNNQWVNYKWNELTEMWLKGFKTYFQGPPRLEYFTRQTSGSMVFSSPVGRVELDNSTVTYLHQSRSRNSWIKVWWQLTVTVDVSQIWPQTTQIGFGVESVVMWSTFKFGKCGSHDCCSPMWNCSCCFAILSVAPPPIKQM